MGKRRSNGAWRDLAAVGGERSAVCSALAERLGNTGLFKNAYGSGWIDDASLGTLGGAADVGTRQKPTSVPDRKAVENVWKQDYTEYEDTNNSTENTYGLTKQEEGSLVAYKSSESYKINAKLRESLDLNDYQRSVIIGMDSALNKLPRYTGRVYRNIAFDDFGGEEAYHAFLDEHAEGQYVFYEAYTSTSSDKEGYPVAGKYRVHIEISGSGRNVAGYGNNMEREILYPRNSLFLITKVEMAEDGAPTIYMQEVVDD